MVDFSEMHPIYIPSKGRPDKCLTAQLLDAEQISFYIVVEPQEQAAYTDNFGAERILVMDKNDQGLIYARNWIKEHSTAAGDERHWQIDDDMQQLNIFLGGKRQKYPLREALAQLNKFIDRYENIALAGIINNAYAFAAQKAPFSVNQMVYGFISVLNEIPCRWRALDEDTDMSLQALSLGWCTVRFNAISFITATSGSNAGGNADNIYQDEGRLAAIKELNRLWPRMVKVRKRGDRVSRDLGNIWQKFDTQLILKSEHRIKE